MSISSPIPTSFATIETIATRSDKIETKNIFTDRRKARNTEIAGVFDELNILKKESGKLLEELSKARASGFYTSAVSLHYTKCLEQLIERICHVRPKILLTPADNLKDVKEFENVHCSLYKQAMNEYTHIKMGLQEAQSKEYVIETVDGKLFSLSPEQASKSLTIQEAKANAPIGVIPVAIPAAIFAIVEKYLASPNISLRLIKKDNFLALHNAALYLNIDGLRLPCEKYATEKLQLSDFTEELSENPYFLPLAKRLSQPFFQKMIEHYFKDSDLSTHLSRIARYVTDFSYYSKFGSLTEALTALKTAGVSVKKLSFVDIRLNTLTKTDFESIASLSGLISLDFSQCITNNDGFIHFTDLLVDCIKKLESINDLNLSGFFMTEVAMRAVGSLKKVKSLDLSSSTVTCDQLNQVANLEKLSVLRLDCCKSLTRMPLKGFFSLEKLILTGTTLDSIGLDPVGQYPGLKYLDISESREINTLPTGCASLKELIASCTGITNASLISAANYPRLEKLDIMLCKNVTQLPEGFLSLTELILYSTLITDEGLKASGKYPMIEYLDITKCKKITTLPEGFLNLKNLIAKESSLTTVGVQHATAYPKLSWLFLKKTACTKLSSRLFQNKSIKIEQ